MNKKSLLGFVLACVCGILPLSLMSMPSSHNLTAGLIGDVDGNGTVDINDLNVVINAILGQDVGYQVDVDGNGVVDIEDLNVVINGILGRQPSVPDGSKTYTVNGVSFTMVRVDGGTFSMGATAEQGSSCQDDEYPVHQVTLSDYSIGATEVTQELWVAVMGSNPSAFCSAANFNYSDNFQRPVERVAWSDCQNFLAKLNELTGETFRLPTEAEWEFAARGGNKSKGYMFAGSNNVDEVAWYLGSIPSSQAFTEGYGTQPVATKAPNELGLYDMSGNVWEWCNDYYGYYNGAAQTNPTGPATGSWHVYRGGGWSNSDPLRCRVARRARSSTSLMDLGLRLAQ